LLSSIFPYQAHGVLTMRHLYLEPAVETTTLTIVGQLRGGANHEAAEGAETAGTAHRRATASTAQAQARGARCVGSIVGTTLAEVLAFTGHRQADGYSGRGERAHQIRCILNALTPAKAALREGGGGADRLALAMGAGSLKVVRTQRNAIDEALPRQHGAKRARRERIDAAYGSVAAALGYVAATLAALAVLGTASAANACFLCEGGWVCDVLRAAVTQLDEWQSSPHVTPAAHASDAQYGEPCLDALRVELRASRRALAAVETAEATAPWSGSVDDAVAHVRSLIDCGVRAAYPPAPVPAALGSPQLRVIPLSEVEDPGLLLFCCADATRIRSDRDGPYGLDGDSDDDDQRSVRSARTSASGSSVASVSSTASGLAEAFVGSLGVL